MKIAIDCREANTKAGIGRLTYSLISEVLKIDKKNKYIVLLSDEDAFSEIKKRNVKKLIFKGAKRAVKKPYWQFVYLPYILKKEKVDIFFSPNNFITPPFFQGKTIVTIQDLVPLVYKDYLNNFFDKIKYHSRVALTAIREPHKVMTISKFSKDEIRRLMKIAEEKIFIINEAIDKRIYQLKPNLEVLNSLNITKPYILGMGGMEIRKNNKRLIEAFISMIQKNKEFKHTLVIVGTEKSKKTPSSNKVIIPEGLSGRVIFTGSLSDSQLATLYSQAEVFVYPSLYEGFGLPPLEAMSYKVPVITSNSSSIPEVVRDSAILINPNSVKDIEKAITKLLKNKDLQKNLIQKGLENIKDFSWERAAQTLISEFEKLIKDDGKI